MARLSGVGADFHAGAAQGFQFLQNRHGRRFAGGGLYRIAGVQTAAYAVGVGDYRVFKPELYHAADFRFEGIPGFVLLFDNDAGALGAGGLGVQGLERGKRGGYAGDFCGGYFPFRTVGGDFRSKIVSPVYQGGLLLRQVVSLL
jgi:hypothetical protein